jgi:hypothetical protein
MKCNTSDSRRCSLGENERIPVDADEGGEKLPAMTTTPPEKATAADDSPTQAMRSENLTGLH